MEFEKQLKVEETGIPGLLLFDLPVHSDARGWFKENWQREKMVALGLPDMGPVQNNISFNTKKGTTRGIHAEPWDKFISVATGSVFGAWVDLRPGEGFGRVFTAVLDPSRSIYVPRGVGNSYQTLEDGTAYTYLVNAHWSAGLKKTYTFVNLADSSLAIPWPIPLGDCEISEADENHPMLKDVIPMAPGRVLVTGANGQLGRAVRNLVNKMGFSDSFDFAGSSEFDITDPDSYKKIDWSLYYAVVNCAGFTAVDSAETPEGRVAAWRTNAEGPAMLARACSGHGVILVHISSDYVFDGVQEVHGEDESLSPLSSYGASKAAGDLAVIGCPRYYILRTSWVVGDGGNFVRTMAMLSDRCADSSDALNRVDVVDDQIGRLTFADDLAEAVLGLLGYRKDLLWPSDSAPFGIYNVSSSGDSCSWADVAREVFRLRNANEECVHPVSTVEYYSRTRGPVAPRPRFSTLDLSKMSTTGFCFSNWKEKMAMYIARLN